mgnify:CR=1 FL=1
MSWSVLDLRGAPEITEPELPPAPRGIPFDVPETVAWLEWERRFVEAVRRVVADDVFQGVPLALTVHSFLVLLHRHGKLKGPGCQPASALGALLRALAHPHGWVGVRKPPARRDLARWQDRVLVAGLNPQDRSRRLWQSLAEALGPERCLLVAAGRSLLRHPPHELPRVAATDFPPDWWVTRAWVLAPLNRWLRGLKAVCAEFEFDPAARWRLAAELVSQVNRLAALLHLQQSLRPRSAVVMWDREPHGAALCAALGVRGVPTFTCVHGAFGRQNRDWFTPLAARYVFTWGEIQTELLCQAGVAAKRLLPVGVFAPRPTRRALSIEERAERLHSLGLATDKPVLVVGLTCLTAGLFPVWAGILQELHRRLPGFAILARLHPSNHRKSFAGLLEEHSRLRLVDDRTLSCAQTLELADAVLVDGSSFGFDALQLHLPVVVLAPPDGSGLLAVLREALLAGAALPAQDVSVAAEVLERLLSVPSVRQEQAARAAAFVDRYVCAYGTEALSGATAALLNPARVSQDRD